MEKFEIYEFESQSGRIFQDDIKARINYVLSKVLFWYPDKVIESLNKNHRKFAEETLVRVRRAAEYSDNKEFFEDYGFVYINKNVINSANKQKREDIGNFINSDSILNEYYQNSLTNEIFISQKNIFSNDFKEIFENIVKENNLNYTIDDMYYYFSATEYKKIEGFVNKKEKIYLVKFKQSSMFYKNVAANMLSDLLYIPPKSNDGFMDDELIEYEFLNEFILSDLSNELSQDELAKIDKCPQITDALLNKIKDYVTESENNISPRLSNKGFLNLLKYKNFIDLNKNRISGAIEVDEDFDYSFRNKYSFDMELSCGSTEFGILKLTPKEFVTFINSLENGFFDIDANSKLKAKSLLKKNENDYNDYFSIKINITDCKKYFKEECDIYYLNMHFNVDAVKRIYNDYYVLFHCYLSTEEKSPVCKYDENTSLNVDRLFIDCLKYYKMTNNQNMLGYFGLTIKEEDIVREPLSPKQKEINNEESIVIEEKKVATEVTNQFVNISTDKNLEKKKCVSFRQSIINTRKRHSMNRM